MKIAKNWDECNNVNNTMAQKNHAQCQICLMSTRLWKDGGEETLLSETLHMLDTLQTKSGTINEVFEVTPRIIFNERHLLSNL